MTRIPLTQSLLSEVMTTEELAKVLAVRRHTVYQLIRNDELSRMGIRVLRVGQHYRFSRHEVERFLG